MSIAEPSGFRRQLSYDETLNLLRRQDDDAGKTLTPGMAREASRFVQSPYFERLKETVYEDLKQGQVRAQLVAVNQQNLQRAAAETGLPPQIIQAMQPPGPQDPPQDPPPSGASGASKGLPRARSSGDRDTRPTAPPVSSKGVKTPSW